MINRKDLIARLAKHERIEAFQTIRIDHLEVYRGKPEVGTYSVSIGNTQVGGGRIPASADPATFPIRMAQAILAQLSS